ncbi:MAG: flagellar basal body P-ring formation chaperone FlgA [Sulfitobacter sp.]
MKGTLQVLATLFALPVFADTIVPTRTIRPTQIILESDLALVAGELPTGFSLPQDVVGQEARVALYAGRPILVGDIGPPAIVTRNQIVSLHYFSQGINIATEGRALERGAVGDRIRVMNLGSRATVFGHILEDGTIQVRN